MGLQIELIFLRQFNYLENQNIELESPTTPFLGSGPHCNQERETGNP